MNTGDAIDDDVFLTPLEKFGNSSNGNERGMTNSGRKTSANSKKQASVEFVSGVPEENTVANQRITRSMKNVSLIW